MDTLIEIERTPQNFAYYYVPQSNPTTAIYCGNDRAIAERLQDMLDEVYWYQNVAPCKSCAPIDYGRLAELRMTAVKAYASSIGIEIVVLDNPPFLLGVA